jgi:RND family efflux transporter MFP subunit
MCASPTLRRGLWLTLCLGPAGCGREGLQTPPALPPAVSVAYPLQQEVTDYAEFSGQLAAVDSVEVRARVTGYLVKVNFVEGSLVKKGDVLIEIDPAIYQTELDEAKGNLASAQARLGRQNADVARAEKLVGKAMSQEQYDTIVGERNETAASILALQAAVERARLNLSYTKVTAPISGRVGRANVTVGNLVQSGDQAGGTLLTTVVSVDPIYVYFNVDENTVLRVREMIRQGKAKSVDQPNVRLPVYVGLANEQGFPHEGTIDFVDNQVDPQTGTLRVRGVLPNPDGFLSPGMFAHVKVPIGEPHQASLIAERAIDTDQGQKVVYVVDENNRVSTRQVQLGARHDGLRAIEAGLNPRDRIVVVGLQQVRGGITVEPKPVEMPRGPTRASQGFETPPATKAAKG